MTRTALDFYEDDEDPDVLLALFEAGEKGVTTMPTSALPYVMWQPSNIHQEG